MVIQKVTLPFSAPWVCSYYPQWVFTFGNCKLWECLLLAPPSTEHWVWCWSSLPYPPRSDHLVCSKRQPLSL